MNKFLTNAQMREADRYTIEELGVPAYELMLKAGRSIAAYALKASEGGRRVTVVCGGGNNGGDGYVCAQELFKSGCNVAVFDASEGSRSPECERAKGDYAGAYADGVGGDVIIDCLFGTGLCRKVEGRYAGIIDGINSSGAYVIAADIPSGLNGDNGMILGTCVRADMTVAIGEYKLGHALGDAPDCCGALVRADIGIEARGEYVLCEDDASVARFFPARRLNSHKGTFGTACLVAGSRTYPGAAALCLSTALRSGCGYVKLASAPEVCASLYAKYPQAIYLPSPDLSADCLLIGPGCGDSPETFSAVHTIMRNYSGKLVLDADALNVIAKNGSSVLGEARADVLITPHLIEFTRLTGKRAAAILADPVGCARDFAREYAVTVLLKGHATVITDGRRTCINVRGNSAQAKGGSGDMLAGFICGSAARGLDLFDAAVCSSYVVGAAAELASGGLTEYCTTAGDIARNVPLAVKNIMCSSL